METLKVVNHTVQQVINNVNYQILAKETLKKLPEHIFKAFDRLKDNIIYIDNIPQPIYKRQPTIKADIMPNLSSQEGLLPNKVPIRKFSQLQIKTPSTSNFSRRRNMSRYSSTADKKQSRNQMHLDLNQVKSNKVIEVINRSQQNTAKTFRSVIELDYQIAQMHKSYLKNLKKEAEIKKGQMKQDFSMRKKRLPKQFTFDFSGQVIQKKSLTPKGILFSPLRTKSVSIQKIQNKIQQSRNNSEVQSNNIQEILQRAQTGSGQKKKRQYNNLSGRQVSHIPYICLAQNTKLIQNDTKFEGQLKNVMMDSTVYSSRKSSFMNYSKQIKEKDQLNMIQMIFPKSFKHSTNSKIGQGKITKIKVLDKEMYNEDSIQELVQFPEATILNKKI